MNQEFKKMVVSNFVNNWQKKLADGNSKEDFLRALKFDQEKVLQFIFRYLFVWSMNALDLPEPKLKLPLIEDYDSACKEVLEALKVNFAQELASITENPASVEAVKS